MGYEHRSDSQQMDDRNDPKRQRPALPDPAPKGGEPINDVQELSHVICGAAGPAGLCDCPGDEHGADPARSMCWRLAEVLIKRGELAALLRPAQPEGEGK